MSYQTLRLEINWNSNRDETINFAINSLETEDRKADTRNDKNSQSSIPSSLQMAELFASVQLAYEMICDGMEIPAHNLRVTQALHPNMSLSLQGLGEPIKALKEIILAVPELIVSLCTLPSAVKLKKSEHRRKIEINEAAIAAIKEAGMVYRKSKKKEKEILVREVLQLNVERNPEVLAHRRSESSNYRVRIIEGSEHEIEDNTPQPPLSLSSATHSSQDFKEADEFLTRTRGSAPDKQKVRKDRKRNKNK